MQYNKHIFHRTKGYLDNGIMVVDHAKLGAHYRASFDYKLDLFAMLPADYLSYVLNTRYKHCFSCLRESILNM